MSNTECPECDETVPEDDLCCGKCVLKAIRRELRQPQTPTTGINAVIGALPDAEEPPPKHDHDECHRILRGTHALREALHKMTTDRDEWRARHAVLVDEITRLEVAYNRLIRESGKTT